MLGYVLLVVVCFDVILIDAKWVRVWEDNFDWNGGIDTNKWNFDVGGRGWGKCVFISTLLV